MPHTPDAHPSATSPLACSIDKRLQCMEVWGGNRAADTRVELTGLDAWVYSKPYQGQHEGGDIHYLSSCASGRVSRLLVADVSGHGTKVASIAAALRDLMRRHVNHADARRVVASLNREFAESAQAGGFATAIVASYWGPTRTLTLCNAGHPRPIWWSGRRGTWDFLDMRSIGAARAADDRENARDGLSAAAGDAAGDGGMVGGGLNTPLGIADAATYDQASLELDEGDVVFVYTDALLEAELVGGADGTAETRGSGQLGERGVRDLVAKAWDEGVTEPMALVRSIVERVPGLGEATRDDVTLVALRRNGRAMDAGVPGAAKIALRYVKGALGVYPGE